ncbi:MAG TPA: nucleoside monophosphate kinase, partial [Bacteroidales bacterium]|nr:nucleoside monophosphate kinase [Bacteroidales bacterium]
RLIEKKLRQSQGQGRGFIFKGYPRTLVQAYILDGLLRKQGSGVSCVINLKVPVFELIRRLDARSRTHSSMPYDGSAATIVARLQEHEERTEPVLEYYASKGQVLNVDAKDNPENVYSMVKVLVSKAIRSLR